VSTTHSTSDTGTRTADERIAALRAELAQLELDGLDDPLRAAADVSAWHTRADQRQRRTVEVETQLRDLEQWGLIAVDHPKSVSMLARAKPRGPAWEFVIRHGTWDESASRKPSNPRPRQTIEGWLAAIQAFAREVGDGENARRVVTREMDQWCHARNAVARAELQDVAGMTIAGPEFKRGGLPPYLRLGVYRTDHQAAEGRDRE
jgi:KaiC/GvpD/RAD55 family RecA-like ATPase